MDMYGLPSDFAASAFAGQELTQVSFTTNTVHFSFDEHHSITAESTFGYRPDAYSVEATQTIPAVRSEIMGLLGKTVLHAEADSDGVLKLEFAGGGSLVFRDDSKEYESYQICIGERQISV